MKKLVTFAMALMFATSLVACGNAGNVDNVKTHIVDSQLYSQKEITAAIDVIKTEFVEWDGCTLTEIYYSGDKITKEHKDWADRHDADEVIVLLSSFDVDSSGGNGSLNPNSSYPNWNWILVREKGGQWKHVDHGY